MVSTSVCVCVCVCVCPVQVMSDVGVLTHLDEFVSKLDRVHLAYKSLRKWFDEGVVMAEVRDGP